MKNIYKNIGVLVLIVGLIASCAKNFDNINYTAKDYTPASSLDLSTSSDLDVDGVTVLESSFRVNFSSTADGVAYYAIFPAGSGSPDVEGLIRESASSFGSGSSAITGGSTTTEVISTGVNPGYSYDVYAVMTSVDGIAGPMKMASFTTPDNTAPLFLPSDSSPSACPCAETTSPFLTSVTLKFSEPVFYQGGDITFEGYFDGAIVVLGAANFVASTDGTTDLTFTTSDMWGVDDFMIGSFNAGTFADNVGLEVDALGGFDYYFLTRPLTFAENIELNLTGTYDYTIDDYSATIPMEYDGQYEVTNDGDEIKVINAASDYYGIDNDFIMRLEEDLDGDGFGFLFLVDSPHQSIYTAGGTQLYWHPYFNYLFTNVAGEYNFNTGEFYYWMDFADELGFNSFYLGWFEYYFTPSAADRSSSRFEGGEFENLPEEIRIEQELRNASDNQYESFETRAETIKLKQDMLDIRRNLGVSIYPLIDDLEFSH